MTRRAALGTAGLAVCAACFVNKQSTAETNKDSTVVQPPPVEKGKSRESQVAWYFANGTCGSQAILATYGDLFGISRETGLKMGCGFSGGLGLTGHACSFVVGAVVLLGLKNGPENVAQKKDYEYTVELAKQFVRDFQQKHKTIVCRELIQYDISTAEAYAKAHDLDVFHNCVQQYLKTTVDLLENKYDVLGLKTKKG